jgi:Xaa-Pro aminopeptidase
MNEQISREAASSVDNPPLVPAEEFASRRRRAVEEAVGRGLRGLLVWSRGGTGVDWYGDVLYLTNHVTPMPQIHDTKAWSGRGHAAVVLPVDDEPILITDVPDYPRESVHIDNVRPTVRLIETVAEILADTGLDSGGLGLVGRQAMLLASFRGLERALSHPLPVEDADGILASLRRTKSDAELACLRYAAAVGVESMTAMLQAVEPGRTEGDVVGEGLQALAANGAFPYDVAVGSGPHSELYQRCGNPSWDASRPLRCGDLLHIDAWGPVISYYTDFARSTVVGGQPSVEQRAALEAPVALVEHVLTHVRPGVRAADLCLAAEDWLRQNELAPGPFSDLFPAYGHSIGLGHEEPWLTREDETRLEPRMVLAVEAFLVKPGIGGAGFEQDVLVTDDGYELLTADCASRWW